MATRQAAPTYPVQRGDGRMEKPQSVVYLNGGQTKVTLIGRWFHMTQNEIEAEFRRRLQEGDPQAVHINTVLCDIIEGLAEGSREAHG
ncbi:MAG TPA: hypothetical protein GX517_05555 [Alicyclobacillus sp.]|nr:hypothetical protein [Alicyclobacillus sp.]